MCSKQSWNRREACHQSRPDMSCKYFLDGTALSIEHSRFSLSEFFHLLCHLFFSFSAFSWCRAEILNGSFLWSSWGRNLVLLEEPCMASLTSSLAHSLGPKFQWPGTQFICKSITPLDLPSQCSPASMTWRCSTWFIRPSCFLCSHNIDLDEQANCSALWWLSVPRTVGWTSWWLRQLSRWSPIIRPTPSASYTVCCWGVPR